MDEAFIEELMNIISEFASDAIDTFVKPGVTVTETDTVAIPHKRRRHKGRGHRGRRH